MIEQKPVIATILYGPNDSTYHRIHLAISEGYKIYVFDNSPDNRSRLFIREHSKDIRYFTFDKNVGIGPALKLMCATAYYEENRTLLYFDQDTIYNKETLNYIYGFIAHSATSTNILQTKNILSVTFRDALTNRKEEQYKNISIGIYDLYTVDLTITSGTLFFLDKLKSVGWHNDNYYVDGVDYSICLSAEKAGFIVTEILNTPGLDHETEQEYASFRFIFKTYKGHKFPINRIIDYIRASLILIAKSALMGSKKAMIILKLLVIFIFTQFMIHISNDK